MSPTLQESRASEVLPTGRTRTNGRACESCHERKVRCDILTSGSPCSNCQVHNKDGCRLYEKKKTRVRRSVRPGGLTSPNNNSPLQPRPPTSNLLRPSRRGILTPEDASEAAQASEAERVPDPRAQRSNRRRRPLQLDMSAPTTRTTASTSDRSEIDASTWNLAEFIDREDVRALEISQTGRLYFIGNELSNLNYLVRQRARAMDPNILHFATPPMGRGLPPVPPEALQLPPDRLCERLIEAYFLHINPGFPIVDEEEFRGIYRGQLCDRPFSLLLLNAVLLAGAHVMSTQRRDDSDDGNGDDDSVDDEDLRSLRSTLFHRAKLLFDARYDKHREKYIQAALLLTWYCDSLEDVISNSWHWIGFATRSAVGMGMHRDATASTLNALDKRQWVRWWWTMFQFDVTISSAYGRPQAIDLSESDCPELAECHFEGISNAEAAFAIHHTRLCIIFSKAMRKITSIQTAREDRDQVIRQADEDLARFITDLPDSLKMPSLEPTAWQSILHLSYNNFLILLHRPSPRKEDARRDASRAGDQSICSDAVTTITSIFESLRCRGKLRHLWLPSLHILFTALVYVAKDFCSANPIVVAKSRRMFESLLATLKELSRHWLYAQSLLRLFEHRKLWQKDEPEDGLPPPHNALLAESTPVNEYQSSVSGSHSTVEGHDNRRNISDGQYGATSQPEDLMSIDPWLYPTSTQPGSHEMAGNLGGALDISMAPSELEMFLASLGNDYLY